ncbi:hypothetical protein HQQ81_18950 [Microbacteriaceae bacterium VKM Ac-2854]|nr:hypothetical protein [Microbacteriaceae bacterium VKM Ac-2854]
MSFASLATAAYVHLAVNTPAPSPTPADFNEDTVTPGLIGFLVMFVIAAAAVLLALDMVRRVRRTTYRAQAQERLAEELREQDPAPK